MEETVDLLEDGRIIQEERRGQERVRVMVEDKLKVAVC